ncbi:MAG: FG-GAP repeat domain-containing protein [Gemmataceae bacterium]
MIKTFNRRRLVLTMIGVVLGALGCVYAFGVLTDPPVLQTSPETSEVTGAQVQQFCAACHAYPPPQTFPRHAWRKEVEQGYAFFRNSTLDIDVPPIEGVIKYYEDRAPKNLTLLPAETSAADPPVGYDPPAIGIPPGEQYAAISNINLVHLSDERKLDLLACDMRAGSVMVMKPYELSPSFRVLASMPFPAHAEVVDLDGDGIKDILVANLGSFGPTDDKKGSVVWLKGKPDGTYLPITLLHDVGRVTDVQAADFRGAGKLDLVVAVFGWRNTGEILYLENQTTDWNNPRFVPRVLDNRHGSIHVCVGDLNKDGKPDFVALISQEHETVIAFLNEGEGKFRKETIYTAPHPAYGSSGIQLVDLNGDDRLDVLYTNGDTLDPPYLLKPYHSVQWLENKGTFPFEHHHITAMPGAMRAIAADFRGAGRQDILAVSFLPKENFPDRRTHKVDSILYLEQSEHGVFVRYSLEKGTCDHMTCAAGAWNGDGQVHFAVGNFPLSKQYPEPVAVSLWKKAVK